jgi:adenylate cyclase
MRRASPGPALAAKLFVTRSKDPNDVWEAILTGTAPVLRYGRNVLRLLPSAPRCKLCNAPFSGPGSVLMKLIGKTPWERNPRICRFCIAALPRRWPGGVELDASLLFADIRGSTALAERMNPARYGELINRFFRTATEAFVRHDAIIDQLVGDEAIGLFLPGYAGPAHAAQAIAAARDLIAAMDNEEAQTRLAVGVGVHTGLVFIGSVGSPESFTDFTALGDAVNTAARLASAAQGGEILVSEASRAAAGIPPGQLEDCLLDLKGKAEPFLAYRLSASARA